MKFMFFHLRFYRKWVENSYLILKQKMWHNYYVTLILGVRQVWTKWIHVRILIIFRDLILIQVTNVIITLRLFFASVIKKKLFSKKLYL